MRIMKKEFKIIKKNSPNKMSRKGWKPDIIVSHITEGSYAGAVSWLCNPKSGASAHFVVSKKGEITQLVDIREAAWCNGTSTDPNKNNYYGKSSLKLVRDRKTNANYYTISIEHEGFYNQGKGKLTPEQLEATIWLHKYIIDEVKKIYGIEIPLDREHIVGHYQIDPVRKPNCPGSAFQFDKIIQALREDVLNMGSVFKDVNDDRWSAPYIKAAKELDIIAGNPDGTFNPTGNLTREQAAVLMVRLYEKITGKKVVK